MFDLSDSGIHATTRLANRNATFLGVIITCNNHGYRLLLVVGCCYATLRNVVLFKVEITLFIPQAIIWFQVWFGLIAFYGISAIVGYLMPNRLYTSILDICDLVCLGSWHINSWKLFKSKPSLYIYIKYIWFGLVGFYGISTIVCNVMRNPFYTYILNI